MDFDPIKGALFFLQKFLKNIGWVLKKRYFCTLKKIKGSEEKEVE